MAKISRRTFLRRTVAGAGGAALLFSGVPFLQAAGPVVFTLRIAHTNDHHARIEETSGVTIQGSTARSLGGVARRKTMFDQIRADAATNSHSLLVLDAGDVFQGTLYFNQYGGIADALCYRLLGYDAITFGNHEFNRGPEGLAPFVQALTAGGTVNGITMSGSNVEVISANTVATATSPINGLYKANIVKTFGATKVGIFGLTTPETTELSSPGATVSFADPVATANAQVAALQAQGCTIIVALSHLGYVSDVSLASQVNGIDIIVGGHSHTPLRPAGDTRPIGPASAGAYPTLQATPDLGQTLIVTAWEWGKWVGDLTVGFDATGVMDTAGITARILPVWAGGLGNPARALLPGEEAEITADATLKGIIDTQFKPAVTALGSGLVGRIGETLDGERVNVRNRQTNLGTLIATAMLEKSEPFAGGKPLAALMNGGGIRASIQPGWVSVGEIITVLPFGNTLARVDVTGAQLRQAIENGVSQVDSANPTNSAGRFPQVGNLTFTFDTTLPAGSRMTSLIYTGPTVGDVVQNTPVDDTKTYRLITNSFLITGGDGYSVLAGIGASLKGDLAFDLAQVVNEYLGANYNSFNLPVMARGA